MPPETEKLSIKEKIGYSLGDTAAILWTEQPGFMEIPASALDDAFAAITAT